MKKFLMVLVLIFGVFFVFADGEKDDKSTCEYARKAQSVQVWKIYLKKFPDGLCSFEAEIAIAKSEDPGINNDSVYQTKENYRPYALVGIPLIVGGALELVNMSLFSAIAAYESSEDDGSWGYFTTAAVTSGVLGVGLLVTGAVLTSIKRPINQKSALNNLSVTPTKGGMFASARFSF